MIKCWHSADASVRHGCHEGCAPQDRRAEDHRQASCAGDPRYISPKRRGILRHSGLRSLFFRSSQDAHSPSISMRCTTRKTCTPSLLPEGRWSEGHDTTAEAFARTKLYLQQYISNFIHSVTKMMRYMTLLQHKDLFLTTSMISPCSKHH